MKTGPLPRDRSVDRAPFSRPSQTVGAALLGGEAGFLGLRRLWGTGVQSRGTGGLAPQPERLLVGQGDQERHPLCQASRQLRKPSICSREGQAAACWAVPGGAPPPPPAGCVPAWLSTGKGWQERNQWCNSLLWWLFLSPFLVFFKCSRVRSVAPRV